jgi:hypothetical protein
MASRSSLNVKSVQKAKEAAVSEAEKRIRRFDRLQRKASRLAEKEEKRREKQRKKLMQPLNGNGSQIVRVAGNENVPSISGYNRSQKSAAILDRSAAQPRFSELVAHRSIDNGPQIANDSIGTFGGTAGVQLNNLLNSVKGTLNGGSSARIVRSLGAVQRKVQSKRQRSELPVGINSEISTVRQNPSVRSVPINRIPGSAGSDSFHSLRSLAGIQRDVDVLYVRRVGTLSCVPSSVATDTDSGNRPSAKLNRCLYTQSVSDLLLLDSLDSNNNTSASRGSRKSAADSGIESERTDGDSWTGKERDAEPNAVKPKKDLLNKSQSDSRGLLNRLCPALKGLFARAAHRRRMAAKLNDTWTLGSTVDGPARAQSEPDLVQASYRLRPDGGCGVNSSSIDPDDEGKEVEDRLPSLKTIGPKSSMFERPGFGSMAFRRNLFGQVWAANGRFSLAKDSSQKRRLPANTLRPNSVGDSATSSISSAKSSISTGSSGVHTELTDDLQIQICHKSSCKARQPLPIVSNSSAIEPEVANDSLQDKAILNDTIPTIDESSESQTEEVDVGNSQQVNELSVDSRSNDDVTSADPLGSTDKSVDCDLIKVALTEEEIAEEEEVCDWQHDVEREVAFERAPTAKCRHICTISINPSIDCSTETSNDCHNCIDRNCNCAIQDTSL